MSMKSISNLITFDVYVSNQAVILLQHPHAAAKGGGQLFLTIQHIFINLQQFLNNS
jgi:hypothetical protein